jgi:hypothetical protein
MEKVESELYSLATLQAASWLTPAQSGHFERAAEVESPSSLSQQAELEPEEAPMIAAMQGGQMGMGT